MQCCHGNKNGDRIVGGWLGAPVTRRVRNVACEVPPTAGSPPTPPPIRRRKRVEAVCDVSMPIQCQGMPGRETGCVLFFQTEGPLLGALSAMSMSALMAPSKAEAVAPVTLPSSCADLEPEAWPAMSSPSAPPLQLPKLLACWFVRTEDFFC